MRIVSKNPAAVIAAQKKLDQCKIPFQAVFTIQELKEWHETHGLSAWKRAFAEKRAELDAFQKCLGPEFHFSSPEEAFEKFSHVPDIHHVSQKTKDHVKVLHLQSPHLQSDKAQHQPRTFSQSANQDVTSAENWFVKLMTWQKVLVILAIIGVSVTAILSVRACMGFRCDQNILCPCVAICLVTALCVAICAGGDGGNAGSGNDTIVYCGSGGDTCGGCGCFGHHHDRNKHNFLLRRDRKPWCGRHHPDPDEEMGGIPLGSYGAQNYRPYQNTNTQPTYQPPMNADYYNQGNYYQNYYPQPLPPAQIGNRPYR